MITVTSDDIAGDLIRFAAAPLFILERNGAIAAANDGGARLLHQPLESLLSRHFGHFVCNGERAGFADFLNRVFSCDAMQSCELSLQCEGPAPCTVRIDARRSADARRCHAAVIDITERVEAELRLVHANQRLALAVAGSGHGVWEFDVQAKRLKWDERMYALYGHTPETFDGSAEQWRACLHPEDAGFVCERFAQLLAGQPVELFEFRILRASDGALRYVEANGSPQFGKHGEVQLLVGTNRDITKRKEDEWSHLRDEERFRTMFEAAPVGIALIDSITGVIHEVNRRFADIAGRSIDDMKTIDWMSITHPDDVQADLDQMRLLNARAISGFRMVKRYIRPDRSTVWIDMSVVPIDLRDEMHPRHLCMIEDITERLALEAQLRQSQKMELVGQLAGGVAHDFNNILSAMLMILDLMRLGKTLPNVESPIDELEGLARRAAKLTAQLLTFARRHATKIVPLDLNAVVAEVVQLLRRVIGEQITVSLQTSSQPLWIEADSAMLDQAIMNLCINARDAMPDGGVLTIDTRAVELTSESAQMDPQARPGQFACLRVCDTGCGMPEDVLQHIFEPFYTTKEVGRGTGLGLASVDGMVHQHHGWLNVESVVGQGSTFAIYLPRAEQTVKLPPPQPAAPANPCGTETILLVEDDSSVRRMSEAALSALGYRVLSASDGREALELWEHRDHEIDLLLTDFALPGGMTGFQLSQALRQRQSTIKVLLMTAGRLGRAEVAPLGSPNMAFLAKPFAMGALANSLRRCLDRGELTLVSSRGLSL